MTSPAILVIPGSARRQALSRRMAAAAAAALTETGAAVTLLDLADHPLPLYNGDLEASQGLPAGVVRLQSLIASHQALLVATPEYNGSVPALLKNTLDWCSRADPSNPSGSGGAIYANKPAAIVSTSPGALGGMRALFHLRDMLGYLGMLVVPQQLAIGQADKAFGPDGKLLDERHVKALAGVAQALTSTTARLSAGRV
jgi:NAD(P)H-dependent FMN reductase